MGRQFTRFNPRLFLNIKSLVSPETGLLFNECVAEGNIVVQPSISAARTIKNLSQHVLLIHGCVFLERKMTNKLILSLAVTASIILTNNTFAADDNSIIVTATRTAQTTDDSLASVTVITHEQIEQQQANDIPELLNGIQGIDISNSGGLGKSTSIYMRGTNAEHVLIFIDGIRIGSATLGTVSIQHIPVSQVERIEIVRGPRASLYGSNAIGGVIQIFTKKAKSNSVTATIGYGSQNTTKASVGLNSISDNDQYAINVAYFDTTGINALKTSDQDKDGYDNTSISANYKHTFSNKSSLTTTLLHAQGNNQYDDSFTATNVVDADYVQQVIGLNYTTEIVNNWQAALKISQSQDKSTNYKNSANNGTFNTQRNMISWQNDLTLSDSLLLTAGIDFQNDKVTSTTAYDVKSRDNTGYFIQQQWFGTSNDLIAAIRADDNEAFGSHTTGNISWGKDLGNDYRIISSYGTAYKAPTFNNLYYPGSSDPTIKPEESESYEIELRGKGKNSHWNINLYQTKINNLIVYPAPSYLVTNLDKSTIEGLEVGATLLQKDFDTSVQLSFIDPTDDSTKKVLARRSKRSLKFNIDENTGKWRSGLEILVKSSRFDNANNTTKLSGYSLVNLNTRYALSKKWTFRANINNLFATKYQTVNNYNSEELGVFASIHYSGE